MIFNSEQQTAITGILEFIKSPFNQNDFTCWAITIKGYAGTGKTTMVQEAIRQAINLKPNFKVCVSAPTNKATQVLKDFGKEAGIAVDSSTIYSLLGLVLGSEGEIRSCFQASEGCFNQYDCIVIDEASMVGSRLTDIIYDQAFKYGIKVIFMGDPNQLNPVREASSKVFNSAEVPKHYSLTQIMRQDEDSPIRKVVHKLRLWSKNGAAPDEFSNDHTGDGDGVHILRGKEFYDTMLAQFDCNEYRNDPTFCRVLAWTNNEVDRLNRMVRQRIYGKGCCQYIVGETVAVLTPVYDASNIPVIFTDEECKVKSIGESLVTDLMDFETLKEGHPQYKVLILELELPDNRGYFKVTALHKDSFTDFNTRTKRLATKANNKSGTWKAFYTFKDMFTKVRPAHCLTVHKSQGQTFKNIFYQCRDAKRNRNSKERAKLAYVACSRATTNLVLNLANLE